MYLVLEIQQATPDAQPAFLNYTAATKNEAASKYHSILASAAISGLYRHTALVMTMNGQYLMRESFYNPMETPVEEGVEE